MREYVTRLIHVAFLIYTWDMTHSSVCVSRVDQCAKANLKWTLAGSVLYIYTHMYIHVCMYM